MDLVLWAGGIIGLAAAAALAWKREPAMAFAVRSAIYIREVRAEVRKITWPAWSELRQQTIAIIIVVVIIGVIIGIMDWLFSIILIQFLGRVAG